MAKKQRKTHHIQVRMTDKELARLDGLAAQTERTRSDVLRQLIRNAHIEPAVILTAVPHREDDDDWE